MRDLTESLLSHFPPLHSALKGCCANGRLLTCCRHRHFIITFFFFPQIFQSHLRLPILTAAQAPPQLEVAAPGLQRASQRALMTRSFNAAAISSPLMSCEGGAGPQSPEQ